MQSGQGVLLKLTMALFFFAFTSIFLEGTNKITLVFWPFLFYSLPPLLPVKILALLEAPGQASLSIQPSMSWVNFTDTLIIL